MLKHHLESREIPRQRSQPSLDEHRVAVEFVSEHDHDYLRDGEIVGMHMSREYDFLAAVRWISRNFAVRDVDPFVYGVFYDPGDGDEHYLRKQVRDFTAWLRRQAVIGNGTSARDPLHLGP